VRGAGQAALNSTFLAAKKVNIKERNEDLNKEGNPNRWQTIEKEKAYKNK
jgi:hypothetical protein